MPCHCDSSKELKPLPCSPKAKVFGWVTLFEMEIVNEIKGKTYKLPVGTGGKHLNWQKFFFYDTRARVFENPDKRGAGNGEWHAVEKARMLSSLANSW
ncbi:putative NAC domain-containing protein 94 [Spatholobus suberectus]|nr:putative NAC domain-containing protein 94 [Spatholobus suberectus]